MKDRLIAIIEPHLAKTTEAEWLADKIIDLLFDENNPCLDCELGEKPFDGCIPSCADRTNFDSTKYNG